MTQKVIVYGKPTCPMVAPVRSTLRWADVDYEYIDLFEDKEARTRVREINGGFESVPTLIFSDGSILTEPTMRELTAKLKALGYDIPPAPAGRMVQILLQNPLLRLSGLLLLAAGTLRGDAISVGGGLIILALVILAGKVA